MRVSSAVLDSASRWPLRSDEVYDLWKSVKRTEQHELERLLEGVVAVLDVVGESDVEEGNGMDWGPRRGVE